MSRTMTWFAIEITNEAGQKRITAAWFYSYTSAREMESRLCRPDEKITRIAVCGNMNIAYRTADEWRKGHRAA